MNIKAPNLQTANTIRIASLNLLNNDHNLETRISNLVEELKIVDPDILCLQEVMDERTYHTLETIADKLGYKSTYHAITVPQMHTGVLFGNAILTKTNLSTSHILDENNLDIFNAAPIITTSFQHNGYNVHVINAHLAWGSNSSGLRTRQAEKISHYATQTRENDPHSIILFAGDLNALENSGTVRYLEGLDETRTGETTLWIDAWKANGTTNNNITSNPTTTLGILTASNFGGGTDDYPKRRIDYIFSYGYCYGRAGYPKTFERFADNDNKEISDHYGIYADILLPTVNS
jgi:endonuclease/exonuclease/phosphatase family metal-dependent hydrolase